MYVCITRSQWVNMLSYHARSGWPFSFMDTDLQIDGLMQERRNSIANALELCLTCTKTSSLQNKCRTADPDRQNLSQSGEFSFFIIYKFWQSCASVWQVSDLILKTGHRNELLPQPGRKAPRGVSQVETMEQSNIDLIMKSYWDRTTVKPLI